ncbi:MAG TPA: ATP-binding cassette domain-containing protein [Planctomycetota bacterium]|jgi:ABC-2 type transport system ATP-binding protein|nr:multidrug ABC transporter ATP-binding protein [Planctomycetota bacterium]MDP7246149.1 ATP-binding cassette domain-containing protein [Planctomycetota bacterium]HJM39836.1 ATP-binding cassette domain-containing protein [Planctomycetota bacterium]|tara:strand:- start:4800 stop:5657 length:858 start_codon:yes stop_codon:yes gene_type:complete
MSSKTVVEVSGLSKSYGDLQALIGADFSIPSGQVVGLLGPNGAGKTTAMKILTGYLAADEGHASICGISVEKDPTESKRLVGYLPENNPLYLDMRVMDFLRFVGKARGLNSSNLKRAVDRSVSSTGLQEVWGRFIGDCSKGFRQRVGLAQALLHDPPLLILDEPTNGLDPLQVVEMRELIRALGRTKTVILTSHVLPEVQTLAERVILLNRGRIVADGSLGDLLGTENDSSVFRVTVKGKEHSKAESLLSEATENSGLQLESIERLGEDLESLFRRLANREDESV